MPHPSAEQPAGGAGSAAPRRRRPPPTHIRGTPPGLRRPRHVPGAAALLVLLVPTLGACRGREEPARLTDVFEVVETLRVTPIEPFGRIPSALVALPDGRLLLPESGGVWIHVADARGQGLTRLGGASDAALGSSRARIGEFRSLSGIAATPDGRVVAADRTSNVLTIFDARLEPADTLIVPEAAGVLQVETPDRARILLAVRPLNPSAGGQVVALGPADSVRGFLARDPIVVHNRWEAIAVTGLELLADGRVLAYWPVFPWANVLSPRGESRPRIGRFSELYKAPSSGPRAGAPMEVLRRWYESFTPLLTVESADSVLAFQYLEAEREPARPRPVSPGRAVAGQERVEGRDSPRPAFVNLYDAGGQVLARDLRLPEGARLLKSNDPARLYLLAESSPRELRIDVLRPDRDRLAELRPGG